MRTWTYGGALKPRNVLIFFPKQKTRKRKNDDSMNEIKHISDGACSYVGP